MKDAGIEARIRYPRPPRLRIGDEVLEFPIGTTDDERYATTGTEHDHEAFDVVWALIHEFDALPGNGAGGTLHIVLDDGNLAEENVVWCREQARKVADEPAFWLAQVLLAFTTDERERMFAPFGCTDCGCNGYGFHACAGRPGETS